MKEDASAKDILPLVTNFNRSLTETRKEIERRFVYYSRLATIGTLAQMLFPRCETRPQLLEASCAVGSPDVLGTCLRPFGKSTSANRRCC